MLTGSDPLQHSRRGLSLRGIRSELALRDLHAARLRPELRLTEVPAPTRIAPHAVAMTVDVLETAVDRDDDGLRALPEDEAGE